MGPSSAMFGRGSTGGVINTVSKTPMMDDFADLSVAAGDGEFYRASADINHAFDASTTARINLMAASSHVKDRDVVRSRRWGVAASLAWGIGTDTTVVANYLHQHDDRIPDYGIVIVQPPGSLVAMPASEYGVGVDRSNFLGFSADADRTTADIFTLRAQHDAGDGLTLTSDSRAGLYERYFRYTPVDRCDDTASTAFCATNLFDGDPATVPNAFMGGGGPYRQRAWGLQNISTARAEFTAGGLRQQLIVGVDLSYQKNDKTFYAYALPPGVSAKSAIPRNLLDPDPQTPAGYQAFLPVGGAISCVGSGVCTTAVNGVSVLTNASGSTTLYSSGHSADYGLFATDRLWLTDQWSVIGTLRFDHYDSTYSTTPIVGAASSLNAASNLVDPRVSLVFEPSKRQTFYLSWGRSATPQGTSIVGSANALTATSNDLEPEVGESFEAGAKASMLNGRLGLSGSIFRVHKNNAKRTDPATNEVEAQSGQRQTVRGVEASVSGRVTADLNLNLAYTYLDAKIDKSFSCTRSAPLVCNLDPYSTGRQAALTPKHAASAWADYKLDSITPGLSVGGGVTYRSKLYLAYRTSGVAPNPTGLSQVAEVPHSLSVDGLIQYRTARWSFALNGYNLTNRLNYAQVFSNRAVPAAGRTFVLSLGAHF